MNRIGTRQHYLIVIAAMRHRSMRGVFWKCQCDCGTVIIVSARAFKGATDIKSCGCVFRQEQSKRWTKTGLSRTPTYSVWQNLRDRCDNPKYKGYHNYGGRGITYDRRWSNFENFLSDMGEAPSGLTIDRSDNEGNYCKENCRWVPHIVNQNNRRNNRVVEYEGRRRTMSNLAREQRVPISGLASRLDAGWTVDQAVRTPFKAPPRSSANGRFQPVERVG